MSAVAIGGIVFVVVFGGALLGLVIRTFVPEDHLSHEARDVIKASFDTRASEVTQLTANVILLDRVMAQPDHPGGPVPLLARLRERDLPGPRAGSAVRGDDPDLQEEPAQLDNRTAAR